MKGRPAESTAGVGAVALLAAYILGFNDPDKVACLAGVLGLVPAAVTLLVDAGGIRGVILRIWRGRSKPADPPVSA